jgi:hypothetical protein
MNDTSKLITPGIKFPGPDGKQYETTGEWRPPKKGEWRLSCYVATQSTHNWETPEIILRELPPPAKPRRVPSEFVCFSSLGRLPRMFRKIEHDNYDEFVWSEGKWRFHDNVGEKTAREWYKDSESDVYVRKVRKPTIEEIAAKFRRDVLPHIAELVDDSSNQFEGYVFAYIMAHDGWSWSNSRDVEFLEMFSSR